MSEHQRWVDREIMETWMSGARGGKAAAIAEMAEETLRAGHAVTWFAPDGVYTLDPDGDIVKMSHQSNEEPKMSDFKVGDVVRVQKVIPAYSREGEQGTICYLGSKYADIDFGAGCIIGGYDMCSLSLVSRPSEAKPAFKVGDKVRVLSAGPYRDHVGEVSQALTSASPYIHQYGVKLYGNHYGFDAHELELIPLSSAPALKVGDRVRMQRGGWRHNERETGKIERLYTGMGGPAAEVRMDAGSATTELLAWMELLPPEPAPKFDAIPPELAEYGRQEVAAWKRHLMGDWEPPSKPMSATAAGILYENAKHGAHDMTLEQVEAFRRAILNSHPALKTYWEKPIGFNPLPEPSNQDGWMPAGTYMPLGRAAVEPTIKMIKVSLPYQKERRATLGCSDGGGSTLATKNIGLVRRGRHWRNQTLSWSNLGDDYELLEDAE